MFVRLKIFVSGHNRINMTQLRSTHIKLHSVQMSTERSKEMASLHSRAAAKRAAVLPYSDARRYFCSNISEIKF
jgi:hypothetical protein